MKYFLLLAWISCLFSYQNAAACLCSTLPKLDSLAQLNNYEFIAHVVITDDGDQVAVTPNPTPGMLAFKIIALFKGKAVNQLVEYDRNGSCDMDISKGEEWILYGVRTNGELFISACNRNIRYREANGERDLVFKRGIEDLEILERLYKKPPKVYPDGLFISRYKNGNKELEENYLNNKLHGVRKLWYANGQLRATENYHNGLWDGKIEWLYPSGQIFGVKYFKDGKRINVSRSYYDTSLHSIDKMLLAQGHKTEASRNPDYKRVQVRNEVVYNTAGSVIISREYYRSGRIQREEFYNGGNERTISIHYYENGVISSILTKPDKQTAAIYQEFDQNGNLQAPGANDQ